MDKLTANIHHFIVLKICAALCPDDSSKIILCSEGLSFAPVLKNTTMLWKKAIFSQYPRYQQAVLILVI